MNLVYWNIFGRGRRIIFLYVSVDPLLPTVYAYCQTKYCIIFVEHVSCLNHVVSDSTSNTIHTYHKQRYETEFTS